MVPFQLLLLNYYYLLNGETIQTNTVEYNMCVE